MMKAVVFNGHPGEVEKKLNTFLAPKEGSLPRGQKEHAKVHIRHIMQSAVNVATDRSPHAELEMQLTVIYEEF